MRSLAVRRHDWPLKEPFVIARGTEVTSHVVVVHVSEAALTGRGEAVGVPYHGESPATICEQIESVRLDIEAGAGRLDLLTLLPAGGARNVLDAALWDLEAKQRQRRAWEIAGFEQFRPVATTVTIGIRSIAAYEARARELARCRWLKVKVSAEHPLESIAAVRRGAPNARLVVDANQAWSVALLQRLAPGLEELSVDLLEQPVPVAEDAALEGFRCRVPICADESVDTIADLPRLMGRYQFANIKLDKTGGLTAALQFAHAARRAGLRLMVGSMVAASVAMAPAMVLAQLCEVADLDGPLLLASDWPDGIQYFEGMMALPSASLWG